MQLPNLRTLLLSLLAGFIFILFNFTDLLRHATAKWLPNSAVGNAAMAVCSWPSSLYSTLGQSPQGLFSTLLHLCIYGLWLYLPCIALLAIVRKTPRIALNGALGFVAGVGSLAIITWAAVVVFYVGWGLLIALNFIFYVLHAVVEFLKPLFLYVMPFILVLGAVSLAVWGVIALWRLLGPKWITGILAACGGLYFAYPVLASFYEKVLLPILQWVGAILLPILRWVGAVLSAILEFLGMIIGWVLVVLIWIAIIISGIGLVLGVVGSVGYLIIDQIKAAWHTGSGYKGILAGSFAIGITLGLILWACTGTPMMSQLADNTWHDTTIVASNASVVYGFTAILPGVLTDASKVIFSAANPPIFDAFVLLFLLTLSFVSIVRGLTRQEEDQFQVTFLSKDLLKLSALLALAIPAIILFALAAVSQGDSS